MKAGRSYWTRRRVATLLLLVGLCLALIYLADPPLLRLPRLPSELSAGA